MKDSNGNEYTWIGGDATTAPCVVAKTGGNTNWYYVLRDHLGNITHLVFASTSTVAGEYSFDSWGRRRDRDDWSYTLVGDPDLLANRGFTGARSVSPCFGERSEDKAVGRTNPAECSESGKWLPWFNLYNMNGRLYDPAVGRFLSPDPIVQNPAYTQNLNRYSYVLNNPLRYNDPTGYRIRIAPGEDELYINQDALRYSGGRMGMGSGKYWSDSFNMSMGNFHIFSASTLGLPIGIDTRTVDFGMKHGVPGYFYNDVSVSPQRRIGRPGSKDFRATFGVGYIRGFVPHGQGDYPLPSWLSWTNNSINTVAYGATVTGGSAGMLSNGTIRFYSNAWKGNQYIKTYNLSKFGTGIGYGTSFLGAGIGAVNFALSDKSWGDYGALGFSMLSSGLTLSGYTAPIGIGIGFIDVAGGFNGFYNYLDNQQHFFNSTGGLMLPVYGIPTFIPIRRP